MNAKNVKLLLIFVLYVMSIALRKLLVEYANVLQEVLKIQVEIVLMIILDAHFLNSLLKST